MKENVFFVFFLIGLLLILMPIASASVIISEVELNPEGTDSGNEWVELFSDSEINLDGWKLMNNDGNEYALAGAINGFLAVNFDSQWLDNSDEKVFLYNGNDLIDETEIFKDDKNNVLTWALCDEWKFIESTKEEKNCDDEPAEQINEPADENNGAIDDEELSEIDNFEENTDDADNNAIDTDEAEDYERINAVDITGQVISEQTKEDNFDSSSSLVYESKSEKIKKSAIYVFAFILLMAIAYILIKDKA